MKKRLKILIILVLLTFQSFSQTDITKDSSIILSKKVATQVAKDLVKGDQCAENLKASKDKVIDLSAKIILKDSVITGLKLNESSFHRDSLLWAAKDTARVNQINIEKKTSKKYKRQRNIGGGIGILGLLYSLWVTFKTLIHY